MRTLRALIPCVGFYAITACATPPSPKVTSVVISQKNEPKNFPSSSALTAGLANHPPKRFWFFWRKYAKHDPLALELDRQRIESLVQHSGWFNASVDDAKIQTNQDDVTLNFELKSGPRAKIERLRLIDTSSVPESIHELLHQKLALLPGHWLSYADIDKSEVTIKKVLLQQGYPFAHATTQAQFERQTGNTGITIQFDAGPLSYHRQPKVLGLTRIPKSFVTNRLTYKLDKKYHPSHYTQTKSHMLGSGHLSQVRIEQKLVEPDGVKAIYHARESSRHELLLGLGAAIETDRFEFRSRGQSIHRSMLTALDTTKLEVRPSISYIFPTDQTEAQWGPELTASAKYQLEDVIIPLLRFEAEAILERRIYEAFNTLGPTFGIHLSRPFLRSYLRASLGTELTLLSISETDPSLELSPNTQYELGLFDPLNLISLLFSVSYNRTNDLLRPTKGTLIRFNTDWGRSLKQRQNYILLTPEVRNYIPITSRLTLANRVLFSWAPQGPLPATKRLYAGGSDSQRGFLRRRLSPTETKVVDNIPVTTKPVGGEALFEGSLELRWWFYVAESFRLGVVGFVDAADATRELNQLALENLFWASGGGFRVDTPIGIIRADIGFRLNRKQDNPITFSSPLCGDNTCAYHISLGEAF